MNSQTYFENQWLYLIVGINSIIVCIFLKNIYVVRLFKNIGESYISKLYTRKEKGGRVSFGGWSQFASQVFMGNQGRKRRVPL